MEGLKYVYLIQLNTGCGITQTLLRTFDFVNIVFEQSVYDLFVFHKKPSCGSPTTLRLFER